MDLKTLNRDISFVLMKDVSFIRLEKIFSGSEWLYQTETFEVSWAQSLRVYEFRLVKEDI